MTALIAVAIAMLVRAYLPPRYHFELSQVSDLADVRAFDRLADEIQQVRNWQTNSRLDNRLVAQVIEETPKAAHLQTVYEVRSAEKFGRCQQSSGRARPDHEFDDTSSVAKYFKGSAGDPGRKIAGERTTGRSQKSDRIAFSKGFIKAHIAPMGFD